MKILNSSSFKYDQESEARKFITGKKEKFDIEQSRMKLRELYHYIIKNIFQTTIFDIHSEETQVLNIPGEVNGNFEFSKNRENSFSSTVLFPLLTPCVEGKVILFGSPGTGKTLLCCAIASLISGITYENFRQSTIQGNPFLTIDQMFVRINLAHLLKGKEVYERMKCLENNFLFIDEINRIPEKIISAGLLSILDNAFFTYHNREFRFPSPFFMFCTANAEDAGSFSLIPPLKDRINIGVISNSWWNNFDFNSGFQFLKNNFFKFKLNLKKIIKYIDNIKITDEALSKLSWFLNSFNTCTQAGENNLYKSKSSDIPLKPKCENCHYFVEQGICYESPSIISRRSISDILKYSKGMAFFLGADSVDFNVLKKIIPFVLFFKLEHSKFSKINNNDNISWINNILDRSMKSYNTFHKDYIKPYDEALKKTKVNMELIEKIAKLDNTARFPMVANLLPKRKTENENNTLNFQGDFRGKTNE